MFGIVWVVIWKCINCIANKPMIIFLSHSQHILSTIIYNRITHQQQNYIFLPSDCLLKLMEIYWKIFYWWWLHNLTFQIYTRVQNQNWLQILMCCLLNWYTYLCHFRTLPANIPFLFDVLSLFELWVSKFIHFYILHFPYCKRAFKKRFSVCLLIQTQQ